MGELFHLNTRQEPWLRKAQLAHALNVSKRFIEYRTSEGMPSRMFAGRREYRRTEVERWLEEHGHLHHHQEGA